MRRRRPDAAVAAPDESGQESFLDTLANLVGVLIILLVIVSMRSRQMTRAERSSDMLSPQLEQARQAAAAAEALEQRVRGHYQDLEREIRAERQMAAVRELERQHVLVALQERKLEAEKRQAAWTEQQRAVESLAQQVMERRTRLDELRHAATALNREASRQEVLEHFPTPIAKTVLKDEVHFRLLNGRLVYVPLDELVEQMRRDWRLKAEQLVASERLMETVGPVGDFRLQYELRRGQLERQTPNGSIVQQTVEFERFVVVPIGRDLGAPLSDALAEGSAFRQRLAHLRPERHTISVWVYPDSYEEHRRLKTWLYERGFQLATWPLSEDGVISGGPNGYRTSAQ